MTLDDMRLAACVVPFAFAAMSAFAQSGAGGCQAEALSDPRRTVLACPNGARIVAEEGTTFSVCLPRSLTVEEQQQRAKSNAAALP